jgi:hypothetical protein
MTHATFRTFSDLLIGDWSGHRRSAALEREAVRSQWRTAFDGSFLQERWHTSGSGDSPDLTAEAFFAVAGSGPGDFIAVYRSGKIAFGESTFEASEWRLTHRWLRESGVAAIRLRFLDDDTYEQEVAEVAPDGSLTPESLAVMRRERTTP